MGDLRVLILEDKPTDAELMLHELKKSGYNPLWKRVDSESDYVSNLKPDLEIILSDYSMPQFTAPRALELLKQKKWDIPFIIITGSISEDIAVQSIKMGADDYLLKDRLTRLGPAVEHALEQKRLRQEKAVAERALLESEKRFRTTAEAAADAIICIEAPDRINFWNSKAEEIFGYSRSEVLGKNLHDFIVPERNREKAKDALRLFFETGGGPYVGKTAEFEAVRKDNTEFPIELSIAAMYINGNWQSVGIVRDITWRKRTEEELKKTMTELERSNIDLQQVAYVASHDLQESLRTVSSYVKFLEMKYKGRFDAEADTFIQYAVEGVSRMSQMLDGLREYLSVQSSGKPFEKVDSDSILSSAKKDLQNLILENDVKIKSGPLPTVMADPEQLLKVFTYLISNAVKFKSDNPPVVHISAIESAGEWVFSVKDNGLGIDPQYQDKIFLIFHRLYGHQYPGIGIGLTICKRIVERHGGRIWFESEPGKGSTFFFTIAKRPA